MVQRPLGSGCAGRPRLPAGRPGALASAGAGSGLAAWTGTGARRTAVDPGGLTRMCASMEGNAIYTLLKLGLADERVDSLVERLLGWQWPDGGWNCDKKPGAHVSSFNETLIPLRGLAWYSRSVDDHRIRRVVQEAAEVFLQRKLFRRITDG